MKKNLLSIGAISNLTGVHVKSLRYYEKIGVLVPTYIDPSSGYRYYAHNLSYKVELIKFAIEMDIPLKQLKLFWENDEVINFKDFLNYTKKIADKKVRSIKNGLNYIKYFEQMIEIQSKHKVGTFYKRNIPQKSLYVIPYELSQREEEIEKTIADLPFSQTALEYGRLIIKTKSDIKRYIFIETKNKYANYTIKPKEYLCIQKYNANIEDARGIFYEYIKEQAEFLIVSTEIFPTKLDINETLNELRFCAID